MTPQEICDLTGLTYCDETCACGQASGLLYFPIGTEIAEWVPAWMNGATPDEVAEWLIEHGKAIDTETADEGGA